MEVLIWHEALGCEDDTATEEESAARIVYFWSHKTHQNALHVLQLLQGGLAFAARFSKVEVDENVPSALISTTLMHIELTTMHYCFAQVEPRIWVALVSCMLK